MNLPTPYVAFDDLTDDILHELDVEAIDWYIDRECADAGVKLLPPAPPQPPQNRVVPKSVPHYIVSGLRFSEQAAAQRVVDAINREAEFRRDTEYLGRHRWSGPTFDKKEESPDVAVSVERVHTHAEAEEQDGIEQRTADAKTAYETAKKEYDAVYSERSDIARRIYNRLSEAHTKIERRERIRREHRRYIALAGGDETIAARFLWKAYGTDAELIGVANPGDVVMRQPEPESSAADEVL